MHIIGTANFESRKAAIRYYRPYGFNAADVDRKIANGEIHIGKPSDIRPGIDSVYVREGRYHIQRGY